AVDRLAGVVQPPRVAERRVVRQRVDRDDVVRLRVPDPWILLQLGDRGVDVAGREVGKGAVDLLPARLLDGVDTLEDLLLFRSRDVGRESAQQVAGRRLRRRLPPGRGLRGGAAQREHAGDDGEKEWYATSALHCCEGGSGRVPTALPA